MPKPPVMPADPSTEPPLRSKWDPLPGSNDREGTVMRGFRLRNDVDRALRALAVRDRTSLTAELTLCVNFRERMLTRATEESGYDWVLVPKGAELPPGSRVVLLDISGA